MKKIFEIEIEADLEDFNSKEVKKALRQYFGYFIDVKELSSEFCECDEPKRDIYYPQFYCLKCGKLIKKFLRSKPQLPPQIKVPYLADSDLTSFINLLREHYNELIDYLKTKEQKNGG